MESGTLELVAIGASVAAGCEPCLRFHLGKGREQGLGEAEIQAAIRIARLVRKGAQANMDRVVGSLVQATGADSLGGGETVPGGSGSDGTPAKGLCCG